MKYLKGYVCVLERNDKQRFCNGSKYLTGGPFSSRKWAEDWAYAIADTTIVRIEENEVPKERIVL